MCGFEAERTILSESKILTLLFKSSDRKDYTVTDLYLDRCRSKEDFILCGNCQVCTNHDVASPVLTTPEVLLLWLEEALMLPGLALSDWLL